jgi:PAS domain S-box-containing protein
MERKKRTTTENETKSIDSNIDEQALRRMTKEELVGAFLAVCRRQPENAVRPDEAHIRDPKLTTRSMSPPTGTVIYTPSKGFLTATSVIEKIFDETFSSFSGLEQFTRFDAFRPDGSRYAPDEWPFMRSLKKGELVKDEEMHVVKADGSIADVLVSSYRAASIYSEDIIIIIKDMTRHRVLVETLQTTEERFRIAQELSPDGFVILRPVRDEQGHVVDFTFIYQNPAMSRMTGTDPKKITGQRLLDLFPHRRGSPIFESYREVAETGESGVREAEYRRDGSTDTIWLRTVIVPVGQNIALLAQDISERRRAEDALRKSHEELERRVRERTAEVQEAYNRLMGETKERERLEEELRQAQKMEAVGTLAGGIAHDFNNMLAVIIGNAEMGLDDLDRDTGPAGNLRQIMKASKRARDLVKQILTFTRKTKAEKNVLALTPLVKETFKLLRGMLPSTIQMNLDIGTGKDTVIADPSQIQQIVMNLATNAAYAMRENGGTLTIVLGDVAMEREILPDKEMKPGTYVRLTVRDTGTGMAEEVRSRIFEPFFTTKEVGQGTGMGLAVVYGIVKSHGGGVTVDTAPGKGTTFSVFLPFADTEAKERQKGRRETPGGNERILLVDDEPEVMETTSKTLERLGYRVTTATNGAKAWDLFRKDQNGFDIVITDQVMPDITGIDLARRVLKERGNIPIILVTGYSETVTPENARSAGISEFVMKPFKKQEVAEAVRRVLDRSSEP